MSRASFDLLLPEGRRVPLDDAITIGRAPGNVVQLSDLAVSRRHARISLGPGGPHVEDSGSSSGTWVNGARLGGPRPVGDGARIRVGNSELIVERRRADSEAGRTVVVPIGATTSFGTKPRLRSGYALKRLDASEGFRRWVLKDLRGGALMRLSDSDARLVQLVDGRRSLPDLVRDAEELDGSNGPMRLAAVLAELSDRGLLAGSEGPTGGAPRPTGWRRLFRPRQRTWDGAGDFFEKLYRAGGWALLTRPALVAMGVVALSGALAFAYLVAGRYGTPFVVAQKVGVGGLVFLVGRLSLTVLHEAAHALTMASFGRRIGTAGVKLVLIFPYGFVETSDAWFESRRRRIAVSAAGPVCDFALGGFFSLLALCLPPGTVRDILFQLALAGYIGGVFNLNPFLQRDGYQMLADLLRQPQLRARANAQFRRRLAGDRRGPESAVFRRYSQFRLAWLGLAGLFATAMSLHYETRFASMLPRPLVWAVMAVMWVAFFVPVAVELVGPLLARARGRNA